MTQAFWLGNGARSSSRRWPRERGEVDAAKALDEEGSIVELRMAEVGMTGPGRRGAEATAAEMQDVNKALSTLGDLDQASTYFPTRGARVGREAISGAILAIIEEYVEA